MSQGSLFLSHSSADNEAAKRLRADLQAAGYAVWIDLEDLEPGSPSWIQAIETALRDCSALILWLTASARSSPWVERETVYVQQLDKPIFIARLNDVPLPFHLATNQAVSFDDYDAGLRKLTSAMRRRLRTGPTPSPDVASFPPIELPELDSRAFFDYIRQMPDGDHMKDVARELYRWGRKQGDVVEFSGRHTPLFHVRVRHADRLVTVFSVMAHLRNPVVQIPLDNLTKYPPFSRHERRLRLVNALNEWLPPTEQLDLERAEGRPTLPLSTAFATAEKLEGFQEIVTVLMADLRASS